MARKSQAEEGKQTVEESDEDKPGVILDYDAEGNLIALEILDTSLRVTAPAQIEYQVASLTS